MINKKQSGSVHVVIVAVLIVIILGLLGYVFWNNFINKPKVTAAASVKTSKTVASTPSPTLKTYTTNEFGLSFKYPSNFSVSEDDSGFSKNGLEVINVSIYDQNSKLVASLETDFEGGQTCPDGSASSNLTTYGSHPVTITNIDSQSTAGVYYTNLIIADDASGSGYDLTYGLVDRAQTDGTQSIACASEVVSLPAFVLFPVTTSQESTQIPNIQFFGSTKGFESISAAEAYTKTSESTQIESMIESLTIPSN